MATSLEETIGSGGSFPINSIRPINDDVDKKLTDGGIWQKSGEIDVNINDYPSATRVDSYIPTSVEFTSIGNSPDDVAFDGTYLWVLSGADIYKFDSQGNYTGFSIDTVQNIGINKALAGLVFNGTELVTVSNDNHNVYAWDLSGNFQGSLFSISSIFLVGDISWDGTNYHIRTDGSTMRVYSPSGSQLSQTVLSATDISLMPRSVTMDGGYYWAAHHYNSSAIDGRVYRLSLQGNLTGFSFPTAYTKYTIGLCPTGNGFALLYNDGIVKTFEDVVVVGLTEPLSHPETGIPYYTRIG